MAARNPAVQYGKIDQGAAGSTTLVTGAAGKRIILKSLALTLSAGGTVEIRSNANAITGAFPLAANGGLVLPPAQGEAWAETVIGEDLRIFSVTGLAKGMFSYVVESG